MRRLRNRNRIRFKVVEYTSDRKIKERTDEILEGLMIGIDDKFYIVRVACKKLSYVVESESIIEGGVVSGESET